MFLLDPSLIKIGSGKGVVTTAVGEVVSPVDANKKTHEIVIDTGGRPQGLETLTTPRPDGRAATNPSADGGKGPIKSQDPRPIQPSPPESSLGDRGVAPKSNERSFDKPVERAVTSTPDRAPAQFQERVAQSRSAATGLETRNSEVQERTKAGSVAAMASRASENPGAQSTKVETSRGSPQGVVQLTKEVSQERVPSSSNARPTNPGSPGAQSTKAESVRGSPQAASQSAKEVAQERVASSSNARSTNPESPDSKNLTRNSAEQKSVAGVESRSATPVKGEQSRQNLQQALAQQTVSTNNNVQSKASERPSAPSMPPASQFVERPIAAKQTIRTNVPEVRASVVETIAQIRDQVRVAPSQVRVKEQSFESKNQNAGDFRRFAEKDVARDRGVGVERATREEPSVRDAKSRRSAEAAAHKGQKGSESHREPGRALKDAVDVQQLKSQTPIGRLLESLAKFVRTCADGTLLEKVQIRLERALSILKTGRAIGGEAIQKSATLTERELREVIALIREGRGLEDLTQEQREAIRAELEDLDKAFDVPLPEEEKKVLVADISGVVVHLNNGKPISGIMIDGGHLGTCQTDDRGIFIFKNIPLETPYALVPRTANHKIFPLRVDGICGELNYHRFSVS